MLAQGPQLVNKTASFDLDDPIADITEGIDTSIILTI